MNYQQHYDKLIYTRSQLQDVRREEKRMGSYYERHHIIPKSHGGSNTKENLILLTAREHFLAHRFLCKIHPKDYRLAWGLAQFCYSNKWLTRPPLTSRQYDAVRNSVRIASLGKTGTFTGKKHTDQSKQIMREKATGRKKSEQSKQKNREHSLGRRHTPETILKCKANKSNVSMDTRAKLSATKLGHKNPNFGINPWDNTAVRNNPRKQELWNRREELLASWQSTGRPHATAFARGVSNEDVTYEPHEVRVMIEWFRRVCDGIV